MCKFRNYDNYEVYENGRIFSYYTNKWLKPGTRKDGYQQVVLFDNEGKPKTYLVHRVVYESVTGEPIPKGYEINHLSENKTENFFANLQLISHKDNINYGSRTQRAAKAISKARINNTKISKSVGAFKNDELIMVFPSAGEAGRNGFDPGNVAACCRGERKTHKGFIWKYI